MAVRRARSPTASNQMARPTSARHPSSASDDDFVGSARHIAPSPHLRWICGRVAGDDVLWLGTAGEDEVTATTLLARSGHRVAAVHGDQASADSTRDRLDAERADVRDRLDLTVSELTALPFEDGSFDAVLVDDALERQFNRSRALAEAKRVVRRGGRLIVTARYGDGSARDITEPVRLEELLDELAPGMAVVEMTLVDGRIGIVAERKQGRDPKLWRRALGVAERRIDEHAAAIDDLRAAIEGAEAERRVAEASAERERERAEAAQERIAELETAVAGATHERDGERGAARIARQRLEELDETVGRIEADLERERESAAVLQQELETVRETVRERDEALREARERIQADESELTALRTRLEQAEGALATARQEADRRNQELDATRDQLRQRESALAEAEAVRQVRERDLERAYERAAERERELAALEERLAAERERAAQRQREWESRLASFEGEAEQRRGKYETELAAAQQAADQRADTVAALERDLAAARSTLQERERERDDARSQARRHEQDLATTRAQLAGMERRAERFETSLKDLRAGTGYKLMRAAWRLRRPFKRSPRSRPTAGTDSGDSDGRSDPSPAPPPRPATAPSAADEVGAATTSAPAAVPATPTRGPSAEPRTGERLTVAAILDEMSAACFAPECDLVPLTLEGWADELDEHRPDLLLVESAWQGNGGEWHYRIAKYPRKDLVGLPALRALIDGCRKRGIPTVFWNKEDPVHFDRFAEAAALFDHVFTTDARCIERYEALPGERTVAALPFAAQPRIHNPAAVVDARSSSPCFAGAWYRDRHPDRRAALEAILDAARPYGLVIYDRTFGTTDPAFGFPERFQPHVLGKLPYERVLDVYKSHKVFLNANSVVDSPTMCSRRVLELAACDTAIVSTPGAALSELLGDAVVQADDAASAAEALERLLEDDDERARITRKARRAVFAEHTYSHRLATIADAVGADASSLRQAPFAPPGTHGAQDDSPWILKLQPGVELSAAALADMRAAALFADADVIGTSPPLDDRAALDHRHVRAVDLRAVLVRREVTAVHDWTVDDETAIHAQMRDWDRDGVRIYAADADWLPATATRPNRPDG